MDYETVAAQTFGQSLTGISVNLLCRDVPREVAFLTEVFGLKAHRASRDFAILVHAGVPLQLHADGTFAAHPLHALLPEAGPRGAGIELRLPGVDPDAAAARLAGFEAVLLQMPTDKAGHGLREAVILCPEGYAWVPSVPLKAS
jgi:catechol 2,3-dioxygenase-like lactoylglutathione lyase family enzyme